MPKPAPALPALSLHQRACHIDELLRQLQNEELEAAQVNVHDIAKSGLAILKPLKKAAGDMILESGGAFVRLAAALLLLKSLSLLPEDMEEKEEEPLEIPSPEELKRQRLERGKYQAAARILYENPLLGRDLHPPGKAAPPASGEVVLSGEGGFFLTKAASRLFGERSLMKPHAPLSPIPSLLSRIRELSDFFIKGARSAFRKLALAKSGRHAPLLTFLSLLELSRLGFVSLFQKRCFSDIQVKSDKDIDQSALEALSQA